MCQQTVTMREFSRFDEEHSSLDSRSTHTHQSETAEHQNQRQDLNSNQKEMKTVHKDNQIDCRLPNSNRRQMTKEYLQKAERKEMLT